MTDLTTQDLHIIDGTHFMHRAYYAVHPLSTKEGIPTNAIKGMMNILEAKIREYNIKYMVVVFDPPRCNTFRAKLYPEYKANRGDKEDRQDLYKQIRIIRKILPKAGFCTVCDERYEADDVIGTIAVRFLKNPFNMVYIHSNDKDFAQLLTPGTILARPDGELVSSANCHKYYGVPHSKIVSWLMFQGDAVDNIPGIPNVGPKTSVDWINQHGSVKRVMKLHAAGKLKGRGTSALTKALENNTLPDFKLTRKLLKIKTDCDINLKRKELCLGKKDVSWLKKARKKLEFSTLFGV